MDTAFDELIALARKIGVVVRHAHLGGDGGGLVLIKGQRVLFIDQDAPAADQLDRTAGAMATLPDWQKIDVPPGVQKLFEQQKPG